ncbi:MAG TPA: hypothetical protein VFB21_13170 [Chthonomonadaceae bacterium]|nr:hypothetical protein [Chthonomonadaceae bacterium]
MKLLVWLKTACSDFLLGFRAGLNEGQNARDKGDWRQGPEEGTKNPGFVPRRPGPVPRRGADAKLLPPLDLEPRCAIH